MCIRSFNVNRKGPGCIEWGKGSNMQQHAAPRTSGSSNRNAAAHHSGAPAARAAGHRRRTSETGCAPVTRTAVAQQKSVLMVLHAICQQLVYAATHCHESTYVTLHKHMRHMAQRKLTIRCRFLQELFHQK